MTEYVLIGGNGRGDRVNIRGEEPAVIRHPTKLRQAGYYARLSAEEYRRHLFRGRTNDGEVESLLMYVHKDIRSEIGILRELCHGYGYKKEVEKAQRESEHWKHAAENAQRESEFWKCRAEHAGNLCDALVDEICTSIKEGE